MTRRVVVFTHDTSDTGWRRRFWLTRDYLPEVADLLVGRPSLIEQAHAIGARMEPVLIPWDCADGFFEAYWRRPEAYLDEHFRRGVSVWARVGPETEQRARNRVAILSRSGLEEVTVGIPGAPGFPVVPPPSAQAARGRPVKLPQSP